MNQRTKEVFAANVMYLVIAICIPGLNTLYSLFLHLNGGNASPDDIISQGFSPYYAVVTSMMEICLLLLPAVILLFLPPFRPMRARMRLSPKFINPSFLLIIPFAIIAVFMVNGVSYVWLSILQGITGAAEPMLSGAPVPQNTFELILAVFAVGLMPALCEEFPFRGVVLTAYTTRKKPTAAILASGVLFAVVHGDITALPAHILLGIFLCLLVLKTGSFWSGAIFHFVYNSAAVVISYTARGQEIPSEIDLPYIDAIMTGTFVTIGLIAFGLMCFLLRLIRVLSQKARMRSDHHMLSLLPGEDRVKFYAYLPLVPALFLVAAAYAINLLETFSLW